MTVDFSSEVMGVRREGKKKKRTYQKSEFYAFHECGKNIHQDQAGLILGHQEWITLRKYIKVGYHKKVLNKKKYVVILIGAKTKALQSSTYRPGKTLGKLETGRYFS
jgi:hypothetical protein